jgi:hypothetical protein
MMIMIIKPILTGNSECSLLHVVMTINTRRPKPSHKTLLDCPNIGTNMIEATREYAQLTNKFLHSTSPIELPLQFGPHLLGHAITASHALGDKRKYKTCIGLQETARIFRIP